MDTSSYFIKNKALFGSFPTQEKVEELEEHGVRYFIDLTYSTEDYINPFRTKYCYINYPIQDHKIPLDWQKFSRFILLLGNIIIRLKKISEDTYEKIYINCRGGHGRSGVVVACLLCHLKGLKAEQALDMTSRYHNNRRVMKDKWRKIGSPQSPVQKNFVRQFFDPIYYYRAYKHGCTVGMSNFSLHPVSTELGTFPTAEAAFQAYKCPTDPEYVEKQRTARTPVYSKQIGRRVELRDDWNEVREALMYKVLRAKFEQHDDIRANLMSTGLRPLVERSNTDNYWGCGYYGTGMNRLGKILTKVRNEFYVKEVSPPKVYRYYYGDGINRT